MFDADETRMIGLPYDEETVQYVKPFSSNTGTSRTDGQTDRRTELLYQYRSTRGYHSAPGLAGGSVYRLSYIIKFSLE